MPCILLCLALMIVTAGVTATNNDPATNQIGNFKKQTSSPIGVLRTSAGAKVDYRSANVSLNSRLLRNEYFLDTMTHLVRERIPERVVHGKGAGAFGYFEVTHDITDICKAKLFSEIGKKTPIAVRFSLLNTEIGGSDKSRESRGFAVKFYTEDGNLDIVGLNMPVFPIKDPVLFPAFAHSSKRNPVNGLLDSDMSWGFRILRKETWNTLVRIYADQGIPYGYHYMPGFGIHTFQVVNELGKSYFVRFHFNPDYGIKTLSSDEAMHLGTTDPDFATRGLYNAIANEDFPSWSVGVQVLNTNDVKNATFNIFDVTKVLPLNKYPLKPVGRLVLNKNPSNFFAEIEQLAFCPCNLVPGILGGVDKLFESRILFYRDAQNYRLGVNFNKILVNQPIIKPLTYNRDGVPPVGDNELGAPNYYPNSFHGPQPYIEENKVELVEIHEDTSDSNDLEQASEFYSNEITEDERTRLIDNLVSSLRLSTKVIQDNVVEVLDMIHPDFGHRVAKSLQIIRTNSDN